MLSTVSSEIICDEAVLMFPFSGVVTSDAFCFRYFNFNELTSFAAVGRIAHNSDPGKLCHLFL